MGHSYCSKGGTEWGGTEWDILIARRSLGGLDNFTMPTLSSSRRDLKFDSSTSLTASFVSRIDSELVVAAARQPDRLCFGFGSQSVDEPRPITATRGLILRDGGSTRADTWTRSIRLARGGFRPTWTFTPFPTMSPLLSGG